MPTVWLCRKCWKLMPRADAEKLPADGDPLYGGADWKCSGCGAVGRFASDSTPEYAEYANDLVVEAYLVNFHDAGYEVLEYSVECDRGNHLQCDGKNRVTDWPQEVRNMEAFKRCFCECHRGSRSSAA